MQGDYLADPRPRASRILYCLIFICLRVRSSFPRKKQIQYYIGRRLAGKKAERKANRQLNLIRHKHVNSVYVVSTYQALKERWFRVMLHCYPTLMLLVSISYSHPKQIIICKHLAHLDACFKDDNEGSRGASSQSPF